MGSALALPAEGDPTRSGLVSPFFQINSSHRREYCLSSDSLGVPGLFRLSATCPACLPCPAMHGSEGSAWWWNLGVPLSDLRPLCVLVAGGESRKTFTQFPNHENVKT